MSEVVKAGGEQVAESLASQNQFEVLTEMSNQFDPEKAAQLVVEKRSENAKVESGRAETSPEVIQAERLNREPKSVERTGSEEREKSTHLAVIPEKPEWKAVEELTPEEASKEYLDLLMDLSVDFTSAEGKSSRAATYNKDGSLQIVNRGYSGRERRIVGQLYETATGKDFREEERKFDGAAPDSGKWEDKYIDRELALGMADDIIAAESEWRNVGESTTIEAEQAEKADLERKKEQARKKLDKIERGIFGKLRKAFYVNFRNKEYNEIYNTAHSQPQTTAEKNAARANAKLQKALEEAYSEDYGYGHHRLSYEHTSRDGTYADKINGEYNDKFFDTKKKEKIDRAIALRRKLQMDKLVDN